MNNINSHVSNLISNYISKDISEKEFHELKSWLHEDSKNEQFFIDHLQIYKKVRRIQFAKILDEDAAWNNIVSKLKHSLEEDVTTKKSTSKSKYIKLIPVISKYAAIAIIFLTISYFYQNDYFGSDEKAVIPSDQITLQFENGTVQIINEDGSTQLVDTKGTIVGTQKGNQLVYNNNIEKETLVYNTLTVPYGKRFEIQLSDGTNVHLNAGTSLKYPVKFIKGEKRQVFLNGEAFFSVAKDIKHPFIVNAENLNVEVLGTEFNVSAYTEDTDTEVVLVEGSVGMYKDSQTIKEGTMLLPGTKGSLNKESLNITTKKVNTLIYTSWRQGGLFFRNIPFKNIVKKMERHFNKKIIITNKLLENETFNANFNDEPIENILSYFNDSFNIKYNIKNNIIYIN
ncbi:FecR domain-containing protein [Mariniflexile litorale]|uniref:FecR domain-containing protein n=1 Tax=Mariniflexile litorale TaxID=3045158 RepID=A0AAU7EAX5_9FLAO|nr:FecR domain-containing protein [Mariniflexile sp. KMM 9835]MDQ8210573.1 FecR domain-containing protein [Mariniflexile sp. KMM 9835]